MHLDLQMVLNKHKLVFETPYVLPPSHGEHDHGIPLILGSLPPNMCPYHHLLHRRITLKRLFRELLEVGVIHPSTSPYSSPMVMVFEKGGD